LGKYPLAVDEPEADDPPIDVMIRELVDEPPAEYQAISTAKMVRPHDFSEGPLEA
jgi:hypothetical protein